MKVSQLARKAVVVGMAIGCAGCASSGSKSWLPAWPGTSTTAAAGAQGVLGSPTPQPTGLAAAWQQTTKSITSAIAPASAQEADAVSLENNPRKIGGEVYLSAARIHEQRGDLAGAILQYQKALQANPKDVTAHVGLGRIYDRQGEYAKAVQQYQKAIQADPKKSLPHNDLALCYARHGEVNKSIGELEQAVKLQPESKLYRNNLATVLVEADREQDALKHLLAAHPPAAAHYNLGALLNRCGKTSEAAAHLRQAIGADPSLTAAQELLSQLEQQPSGHYATAPVTPAPSQGTKWQGDSSLAHSPPVSPVVKPDSIPSVDSASNAPVPSAPPRYAPGSIYHISDGDQPAPVFMGQRESRLAPADEENAQPAPSAVTSFLGKPVWKKQMLKDVEPRETPPPQTLELNEDLVKASAVPMEDEEQSDLRPVSFELEIDAP